jgi:hypothetical protein
MKSKLIKRNRGLHRCYFALFAIGFSQVIFLLLIFTYQHHHQTLPPHAPDPEFLHPATVKENYIAKQRNSNVRDKEKLLFSQVVAKHFNVTKFALTNPFDKKHHQETFQRPLLTELVRNPRSNIILQDVDFLLDFAIVGFAKVGQEFRFLGL